MATMVRTATEQDLQQLAVQMEGQPGWLGWAQAALRRRAAVVLVAQRDARPVGYCVARAVQRGYQARPDGIKAWARHWLASTEARPDAILRPLAFGLIEALWVEPAVRLQGVARALMTNSARWLEAMGVSELQVIVDSEDERVQGLFRRMGFQPMQLLMRRPLGEPQAQAAEAHFASPADLPQLAHLLRQEVSYQHQLAATFELLPTVDWQRFVAAKLRAHDTRLLVVEHDGRLAGYLEARVASRLAGGAGRRLLQAASHKAGSKLREALGIIEDIYVAPELRRQGLATILVYKSFDWFHTEGASSVSAGMWACNDASLRFFSGLGFEPVRLAMRRSLEGLREDKPAFGPLVVVGR